VWQNEATAFGPARQGDATLQLLTRAFVSSVPINRCFRVSIRLADDQHDELQACASERTLVHTRLSATPQTPTTDADRAHDRTKPCTHTKLKSLNRAKSKDLFGIGAVTSSGYPLTLSHVGDVSAHNDPIHRW